MRLTISPSGGQRREDAARWRRRGGCGCGADPTLAQLLARRRQERASQILKPSASNFDNSGELKLTILNQNFEHPTNFDLNDRR
jgi:hypothetical protein